MSDCIPNHDSWKVIEIATSEVIVQERFRKREDDYTDPRDLSVSLSDDGLLNPIIITPDKVLVCGLRRLHTMHRCGQQTILARVLDIDPMLGQIAENCYREDYTPSEKVAIVEFLKTYKHGGTRKKQGVNLRNGFTASDACLKVGWSESTYEHARKVVQHGSATVIEKMDNGELSIHAAWTMVDQTDSPEEQDEVLLKPNSGHHLLGDKPAAAKIAKFIERKRQAVKYEEQLAAAYKAPRKKDDIQLWHCPFREFEDVSGLQPASVNLVLTDIPYADDWIENVEPLAEFSKKVLVDGGLFCAFLGHGKYDQKLAAISKHLTYRWQLVEVFAGGVGSPRYELDMVSSWNPIVLYSKGDWKKNVKWNDVVRNATESSVIESSYEKKEWHEWGKNLATIEKLVNYFSSGGGLVCDPCLGGGTTAVACRNLKRKFVGCDVVEKSVAMSQKRLAETPVVCNLKVKGKSKKKVSELATAT